MDKGKGYLSLFEVCAHALAKNSIVGGIIENVISKLKSHAKVVSEIS